MKSVRNILGKIILNIVGAIMIIGGIFITAAGLFGGFGATTIARHAGVVLIGIGALAMGLYSLYLASGRNIGKTLERILDAILRNI